MDTQMDGELWLIDLIAVLVIKSPVLNELTGALALGSELSLRQFFFMQLI
jgi:hypothetical protein